MKKINLSITGSLGRMGRQLIKSSKSSKNFKLVSITENRIINKKISENAFEKSKFEKPPLPPVPSKAACPNWS